MNHWLLDTVTVSELRKETNRQDLNVARWRKKTQLSSCWLSVITILEIQTGMLQIRKKDPDFSARLQVWLESFVLERFRYRIFDIDSRVVQKAAVFRAELKLDVPDALIAATAGAYDLTLVTRNISDFRGTGVDLLNPWESQ